MSYAFGQKVRVRINDPKFTNSDGDYYDPTEVIFRTESPGGVETAYTYGEDDEVVKHGTGDYSLDWLPDESGDWYVRVEADGVIATRDIIVRVADTRFSTAGE
jgi:hypothetical protein